MHNRQDGRGLMNVPLLVVVLAGRALAQQCTCTQQSSVVDSVFTQRTVVTNEAKGARCAVAADLDGDGRLDLVSASSTDNTVAWYKNENTGQWSGKQDITYSSNGARIVTTGDIDGDGVSNDAHARPLANHSHAEPQRASCAVRTHSGCRARAGRRRHLRLVLRRHDPLV